jgi:hypothetical protein
MLDWDREVPHRNWPYTWRPPGVGVNHLRPWNILQQLRSLRRGSHLLHLAAGLDPYAGSGNMMFGTRIRKESG